MHFVYKYSGLKWIVDKIDGKITNYRLCLRIVPVSYKLFLVSLGVIGGTAWHIAVTQYQKEALPINFEQEARINIAQAQELPQVDPIEALSALIWQRESTKGINNYSKCEAQGKFNTIGYGIPGNGSYLCFASHEDEMQALKGWLITHKAQGMTEKEMLCLYSGSHYQECQ